MSFIHKSGHLDELAQFFDVELPVVVRLAVGHHPDHQFSVQVLHPKTIGKPGQDLGWSKKSFTTNLPCGAGYRCADIV